jgi:uncharacterized protein (DUF1499 family)
MNLLIVLLLVTALALFFAGRAGLLRSKASKFIGVTDGQLAGAKTKTQNTVASQCAAKPGDYHAIAPIALGALDGNTAMHRLREAVQTMPGANVVRSEPNYLYAEFETKWLRFVDDVEFLLVPKEAVIHVRSSSRLGRKDFGVNRARIEALRARLSSH